MTSSPVAVSPLLQPITLGPLTLPNRVVMASMHVGLEDRHDDLPQLASLTLSPCVASTSGIAVLGARAQIAPTRDSRDPQARVL